MRDQLVADVLAKSIWADWTRTPITGDASSRRYFRLRKASEADIIVMDDPSRTTAKFAEIATFLTLSGFAAPEIYLHDPKLGIMVIEDLGPNDFAAHLHNEPNGEALLYKVATQTLCYLNNQKTDLELGAIDAYTAPTMINLAALHYAPDPSCENALCDAMQSAFQAQVDPSPHLALRDFHAENLIWRPEQKGLDRVGLLDFQDACYAPAGYDLMSLIRDARRDVDKKIALDCITQFCEATDRNPQEFSAHLACISAQRNLRILGIFARLSKQDGKTKYLSFLPRVWDHLMTDLSHPTLFELQSTVAQHLPPPNAETLQRLQS